MRRQRPPQAPCSAHDIRAGGEHVTFRAAARHGPTRATRFIALARRAQTVTEFSRIGGELYAEGVPLAAIAAQFGTPCYVYSRRALEARYRSFDDAFAGIPHLVCYAVKANSNLAVLNLLARLGSGFDIVSGGE